MSSRISFLLFACFLFPITLIAKTIVVDQTGNGDYIQISQALTNSSDGDTIIVKAGVYVESVNIYKAITIIGEGSEVTTIVQSGYAVQFLNDYGSTLMNFAIKNNSSIGVLCGRYEHRNKNGTLRNCIIEDCAGSNIIEVGYSSALTIENCIFRNNKTTAPHINIIESNANIINCVIHDNSNSLIRFDAGGNVTIQNCILVNNDGYISDSFKQYVTNLYNCIWNSGEGTGLGEINQDPKFQNLADFNYLLSDDSPCIDAGNPSPVYYDPDSTRNDMGIYGGPYSWQDDDPVPVELSNFNAYLQNDKVVLRWKTCTETDNFGFEIQRRTSMDEIFTKIGFVEGKGTNLTLCNYVYEDLDVYHGKYYYRLKQIDFNGSFEYSNTIEVAIESLKDFSLKQNYPNPFNPTTTISFELPKKSAIKLAIYSITGKEIEVVTKGEYEPGFHNIFFDAKNLNSGLYFYRLETDAFIAVKKLMVLK